MSTKKVILIVESLDNGSVENWLIRMYRYGVVNGHRLDWTFFCIESFSGRHEQKMLALGARIIHSEYSWNRPFDLIKALRKELKRGNYDVLHSQHDFMSALYLMSALNLPIKTIVHVHNMDEHIPTKSYLKGKILRFFFRRVCWWLSDTIVGVSKHTLNRFILEKKSLRRKSLIHYCGIDALPFFNSYREEQDFKKRFNLKVDTKILLFANRLAPAKNPLFVVEVLRELVGLDKNVVGFFVGSGSLKFEIIDAINRYGLNDNSRFLGWSDEIPYLMKNSDVFILPHLEYPMEGLGLAVVEAQLSKLPVLISNGVSMDAIMPGVLFKQLSLEDSASEWAKASLSLMEQKKTYDFDLEKVFQLSHFNMKNAFNNLLELHER